MKAELGFVKNEVQPAVTFVSELAFPTILPGQAFSGPVRWYPLGSGSPIAV